MNIENEEQYQFEINCQGEAESEMLGDGSVRCCDNGDFDEKHECLKVKTLNV